MVNVQNPPGEPIAIIGSACRFPGESSSPSKLWELLREPRDVSKLIPDSRFTTEGYHNKDPLHHGTTNVRHSYLLSEDVRLFDAGFFGIKPVEAISVDPQQRILMETVYECLESAGLAFETLQGSQTGVYVGIMCGDYAELLGRDIDTLPTYYGTGTARSIISNRISYFFDWHGPSMTIDTACSSSLIAMHQAVQSLRAGDIPTAVVAGSNLLLSPGMYVAESKLKMLSPTGKSRMWDEDADGYARGDGVGALVLKTLSQALADGDHIECLVRETGTNQDGRTKGITMPSSTAQAALIRDTYSRAGLDISKPSGRPQYFEAHGTGTPAGDPIEAQAISSAFFSPESGFSGSPGDSPLYVGSIKTVIGHTEGTAGIAGVIKASLALQHGIIPPNLHLNKLNPAIQPFYGNLNIAKEAQEWPALSEGTPRRISVNSFGFGGANAHAILESYPATTGQQQLTLAPSTLSHIGPFNFSASTETALRDLLAKYSLHLKANTSISLRELSWTLNARRSTLSVRTTISARTVEGLIVKLDELAANPQGLLTVNALATATAPSDRRLLGIFTGQGAQWPTMGSQLIQGSRLASDTIDQLQTSLDSLPSEYRPTWSLRAELLKTKESSRVTQAEISQPLCAAVQIVLVDLLRAANVRFKAVVGHSSGEIIAAYAAGFFSAFDAIRIAYLRGFSLTLAKGGAPGSETGAMLAAGTSFEDAAGLVELESLQGRIVVAASNSPESVTLSGDSDAIEEAKQILEDEGKFARLLKVDKAYHSHHMVPSSQPYIDTMKKVSVRVQQPPTTGEYPIWVSSVLGDAIDGVTTSELSAEYWSRNMVSPVLFSQAVEFALGAHGPFDLAVEVGAHPALKSPALNTIQAATGQSIPYTGILRRGADDLEAFGEGLGYIWQNFGGGIVDFTGLELNGHGSGVEIPKPTVLKGLPGYPWEHDRQYWHESRYSKALRNNHQPPHPLLGSRVPDGTQNESRWRNYLNVREVPWLVQHQIQRQIIFPAAGYLAAVVEALVQLYGQESVQLVDFSDIIIGQALVLEEDESSVEILVSFREINRDAKEAKGVFAFYSEPPSGKGTGQLAMNSSGQVAVSLGIPSDDALPEPYQPKGQFLSIESERFYKATDELGFGYSGSFRKLVHTRRRMDEAIGEIQIPDLEDEGDVPIIVHPGTLDSAIQSTMLAFSYPGDGRLRSIYLPTGIDRLRINPWAYAKHKGAPGSRLAFYSAVEPDRPTDLNGGFEVSTLDRRVTLIQLQGLRTTPLTPASAENDRNLFTETTWAPESPSGNGPLVGTDAEDEALALDMERVAYYYMREVDKVVVPADRYALEKHHQAFYRYFDHNLSWVAKGTHPFLKEPINDSSLDILKIFDKYPESLDLRLMKLVGENLPRALRQGINILEVMFKDNLLNDFYSRGFGMQRYLVEAARIVSQVSHRFPRQNILEIGAGTGSATNEILPQLQEAFASYTYTDVSSGFFEQAQERFEKHRNRLIFKPLDIEKDVEEQGFVPYSYDLVVASLVLHATRNLEQTMTNVRRLLRPGGRLVIVEVTDNNPLRLGLIFSGLPGLWLGDEDNRKLSPCVSAEEWEAIARKTGFSNIDAITPHNITYPLPLSVIVFQAVDARVDFLRQPLATATESLALDYLTIIGGNTPRTLNLARAIEAIAGRHYLQVAHFKSLEATSKAGLPLLGSVVGLVDAEDTPFFKDVTAEKLTGLKEVFKQSKVVLWVSQGPDEDAPYRNMYRGLERSIKIEMTHLQSQFLEFDSSADLDSSLVAEKLLQLEASAVYQQEGRLDDLVWYVEPEVRVTKSAVYVPRIKLSTRRNQRYNSARRTITHETEPGGSIVSVKYNGTAYRTGTTDAPGEDATPDHVEVHLSHSFIRPVRVTPLVFLFLSVGEDVQSGKQLFTLSRSLDSRVRVPRHWTVPLPSGDAISFLHAIYSHFAAESFLSDAQVGDGVVVLDAERSVGDAIAKHAAEKLLHVVLISSATSNEILTKPWARLHPYTTNQSARQVLPTNFARLVTLGDQGNLKDVFKSFLPQTAPVLDLDWLNGNPSLPATTGFEDHLTITAKLQAAWRPWNASTRSAGHNSFPIVAIDELTSRPASQHGQGILSWPGTLQKVPIQLQPAGKLVTFAKDRTYWLVGLTGGLGLSLCEWMARHGAGYIVISSRNPRLDSSWLQKMADLGCTVRAFSNDITNRDAVRSLYKSITESLPPIAGVAQGAMVLDDAMFPDLDLESYRKVSRPKVEGSLWLDELFFEATLDWFVFFSSITYVTGNAGQSAYAASNGFMTSLAEQRRRRGLAGSAMNIGVIMGNGYVSRELNLDQQTYLHRVGHWWMSEQDFHQLFAECVLASRPGSIDTSEFITGLRLDNDDEKNWIENPIFQHLVSNSVDAVAGTSKTKSGVTIKAQLEEATSEEQVFEILKDGLIHKLQVVLQADPSKEMLETSPDELGVDSLVAVDIRSWFLKEPGVDLPVLKILNSASVRELVLSAQQLLPDSTIPLISGAPATETQVNTSAGIQPAAKPKPQKLAPSTSAPTMHRPSRTPSLVPSLGPSLPLSSPKPETDSDGTIPRNGSSASSLSPKTASTPITNVASEGLGELSNALRKHSSEAATRLVAERTIPMSFGQSRFWFLKSYVEDQTAFNITTAIRLNGRVDGDKLEKAVASVSQRHEALRTFFYTNDNTKEHIQAVLPKSVLRLERRSIREKAEVDGAIRDLKNHVYDLEGGKLLRIQLLSQSPDSHWLLIGYHHINMDGLGYIVFLTDLEKSYKGELGNGPVVQYPDFTIRQFEEYKTGRWAKEILFWRDQFASLPEPFPVLPLSRLGLRPTALQLGSHSVSFRLDRGISDKVDKVCTRFKITPFHFHLTVFHTLLFRYSGELQDITIGVADGNRKEADTLRSLGIYMNLLPLRIKRNATQPFSEALRSVQAVVQDAFNNSRVPFDVILAELDVPRTPSHSPLFQTFLNYRQNIKEARTVFGAEGELEIISAGENNYDISIDILDNSGGGNDLVTIAVQKDLFSLEAANTLKNSYASLLRQFVENPALRVSRANLYGQEQVEETIIAARGSELTPEYPTVVDRIDAIALQYASQTALRDTHGQVLSYAELQGRVSSIAEHLASRHIGSDSRVGVFQDPGLDWIASLLAILRVGAAYIPFDPSVGLDRLVLVAEDSNTTAFLVDSYTRTLPFATRQGLRSIIDVSQLSRSSSKGTFENRAKAGEPSIIMYTSGSTGTPKGIVTTHSNWNNWVDATPATWGIREGREIGLQQSSYTFDMSLLQIFTIISRGGTLVVPDKNERHDPAALFKLVEQEGITYTCCTPTEYIAWLSFGDQQRLRASSWRLAVTGGEAITKQVVQEFQRLAKPGLRLFNCYGPTETTIGCGDAEVPYNRIALDVASDILEFPLTPTPNYSVYVVDEKQRPVPAGIPGEVVIGGAGVSLGYLNNDGLTAEKFVADNHASAFFQSHSWNRIHRSGDRGRLTEDGRLVLMGRVEGDTQVKLGGIRIDLEDVEATITKQHDGVIRAVVVSARKSHNSDTPFLAAFVVLAGSLDSGNKTRFLAELPRSLSLPQYMRPAVVVEIDALPRTAAGKLDRRAVNTIPLPGDVSVVGDSSSAIASGHPLDLEQRLWDLWLEVLPVARLATANRSTANSAADFFHVGGSSLSLINLQGLIKKKLGATISLQQLFGASSLGPMAALLQPQDLQSASSKTQQHEPSSQLLPVDSVDWTKEAALDPTLQSNDSVEPPAGTPSIIIMTGATGFIGREVLRQLINDPGVIKIYALAIRRKQIDLPQDLFGHEKVTWYRGDLGAPRLGLNDEQVASVFMTAEAVIHAGADVSFMKSYQSIKPTNVASTKELVRLCLPFRLPLHFVSSAGVARLAGRDTFGPHSIAAYPPSSDNAADGYLSAKWVCETYVEQAAEQLGLPVWVHRPSSVTGDGAGKLDLMSNMIKYMNETRAVVDAREWKGRVDLISVGTVAASIVDQVLSNDYGRANGAVRYLHQVGETVLSMDDLRSELNTSSSGEGLEVLPLDQWVERAEQAGLSPLLGAYLRQVSGGQVLLPNLTNES